MSLRFVTSLGGGGLGPSGPSGPLSSNFSRGSYITGAVPIYTPSTGVAVSAVGLVTGLTAINRASGNCWGALPAGYLSAAGAGSAAGIYFGQIQSTTSILFFNNLLAAGSLNNSFSTPASPTAFSGLAGGTFTQVTGNQQVLTIALAANILGPNGYAILDFTQGNNNSAGAKNVVINFGASQIYNTGNTTNVLGRAFHSIVNQGVTNQQLSENVGALGGTGGMGAPALTAVDTTALVNLNIFNNIAVATDWMSLEKIVIMVYPG